MDAEPKWWLWNLGASSHISMDGGMFPVPALLFSQVHALRLHYNSIYTWFWIIGSGLYALGNFRMKTTMITRYLEAVMSAQSFLLWAYSR